MKTGEAEREDGQIKIEICLREMKDGYEKNNRKRKEEIS